MKRGAGQPLRCSWEGCHRWRPKEPEMGSERLAQNQRAQYEELITFLWS